MLFFFSEGKFGNQLFQYAFLESIRRDGETIVAAGLDDVRKYCVTRPFINISRYNRLSRICGYEIGERVISLLARSRLIATIKVNTEVKNGILREKTTYTKIPGLFSSIIYVARGYFQSEAFINKNKTRFLKLKEFYIQKAKLILRQVPSQMVPIFVHVRKGDYRDFTISGKKTFLPLSYYHKAITWFTKEYKNTYFVFVSDEPHSIQDDFGKTLNKIVSLDNDPGVDMAIMALCKGGILSPSSFSWWGAYFMDHRRDIIAPMYWLGHNLGVEYHEGTTPSYAKTIRVTR